MTAAALTLSTQVPVNALAGFNQSYCIQVLKSDNVQYNTMGQWVDEMIVPPSDDPMFIFDRL